MPVARQSVLREVLISLACFLVALPASGQWSKQSGGTLVITGGWLFDGISDKRVSNPGILMESGKITRLDVGKEAPADSPSIKLTANQTILPGMVDLHAHYNLDMVDAGRVEEVAYNGRVFLANGVTATWSAGEYYPERVLAQRERIDSGIAPGPHRAVDG